ncbi:toMV resistant protein Tm-2 netted virescent-like [Gastrolobium bilobum]|uniref:toMV resistant protein Tm-2 netted virescent-like n=1 Tax=Gastrolobium bilobum TaxID=150636 RepID=UPI002AB166EA|nr:toMV resistant protein Tm-2 netted virescent-like [Gastrolobium bilobum]
MADIAVSLAPFLKDVDKRAAAEGDNTEDGIKKWVKMLREQAIRIEDVIDEYMIYVEQNPHDLGCECFLCNIVHFIKTLIPRRRISSEIRNIKSSLREITEESGSNSSRERQNVNSQDPQRMGYRYIEEDQLVSFDAPRDELIGWRVEGQAERTVISVVGMGGQGKPLLPRKFLTTKRYVVLFDDVWNNNFWDDIKSAVINNKNGSRIFITTRNMHVAQFSKESSLVKVLELQLLTPEKSFELFCKRAFQSDFDICCPEELIDISSKIVEKCNGLPLAIVAIAGILAASKNKNALEWIKFNQSLSSELEKESRLTDITKILGLSYDDLPDYLKPCLLYFRIYPEDYVVKSKRLIQQWITEGFVTSEE